MQVNCVTDSNGNFNIQSSDFTFVNNANYSFSYSIVSLNYSENFTFTYVFYETWPQIACPQIKFAQY